MLMDVAVRLEKAGAEFVVICTNFILEKRKALYYGKAEHFDLKINLWAEGEVFL